MKYVLRTSIILLVIALTGCSYFHRPSYIQSRDKAYLAAHSIPPLKIPPGMASSEFHNAYPVSDREYSTSPKTVDLTPPGLNR